MLSPPAISVNFCLGLIRSIFQPMRDILIDEESLARFASLIARLTKKRVSNAPESGGEKSSLTVN